MRAYRAEKKVSQDGKIQLEALPFEAGEVVEVIVLACERVEEEQGSLHSLKGSVVKYIDPTEPVAQNDWGVLQ